jgi:hypothetical protein
MLQKDLGDVDQSNGYKHPPRGKRAPATIVHQDIDLPHKRMTLQGSYSRSNDSSVTTESLQMNEISEMIDCRINTKMAEVIRETDVKIKAAVDPLSTKIDGLEGTLDANFARFTDKVTALLSNIQVAPDSGDQGGLTLPPRGPSKFSMVASTPMRGVTSPQNE